MTLAPCETGIPANCAAVLAEIHAISVEIGRLQAELRVAAPQDKAQLVAEIREKNAERRERQAAYATCAGNPQPVESTFTGTATIAFSDSRLPTQSVPVTATAIFSAQRDTVTLTRMDDIVSDPFDTGILGTNVTTVHLERPATGRVLPGCNLTLRVQLRFDHSIELPIPFYEEDSDLDVLLSTAASGGTAIDVSGHAVLTGGAAFQGGVLGSQQVSCTLTMDGIFSPRP
jgi:hypothetical protein